MYSTRVGTISSSQRWSMNFLVRAISIIRQSRSERTSLPRYRTRPLSETRIARTGARTIATISCIGWHIEAPERVLQARMVQHVYHSRERALGAIEIAWVDQQVVVEAVAGFPHG